MPVGLTAAILVPAGEGAAQQDQKVGERDQEVEEPAERCRGEEYRQFDFWVGMWEVHDADGELVGHNEILRAARGCALLERWRGLGGGRGVSINTYDPDLERWTQRWVGDGSTLWLEGGLEDGRMVLTGTSPRSTPRGAVLDRITWMPLPNGRVRQFWEISDDSGATWSPIFEGFYSAAEVD